MILQEQIYLFINLIGLRSFYTIFPFNFQSSFHILIYCLKDFFLSHMNFICLAAFRDFIENLNSLCLKFNLKTADLIFIKFHLNLYLINLADKVFNGTLAIPVGLTKHNKLVNLLDG